MEQAKKFIQKTKKIIKISSIVTLTLELIFFISKEIVDLHYSNNNEETIDQYNQKFKLSLFRIIGNGVFYLFILIILFFNYYNALLMGGIIYLIFGLIAFLYLIIEMNTTAASESRPIEYYENNIKLF